MSTKRQKVAASLANFGVALSLLAAIACVFQPGGRKLRFAGPCGKDLCTCQIELETKPIRAEPLVPTAPNHSALIDMCEKLGTVCFSFAPAQGSWQFVTSGSGEQRGILLSSTLFLDPVKPVLVSLDYSRQALSLPEPTSTISEPSVLPAYPPPKPFSA